jgi:hypothetical protein
MKVTRYTPWLIPFLLYAACSSRDDESHGVGGGDDGGTSSGGSSGLVGGTNSGGSGAVIIQGGASGSASGGTAPTGPCTGLRCDQTTCTEGNCTQMPCETGTSTTISGTVYAPNGTLPLYNVIVYVPNGEVMAFAEGASCDRCGQNILNPVTSTLTDTAGHFVLPNAPVGENIPLVIQIGKWRRQVTVSNVPRCVDTALTDHEQTSLPSNKTEGDIPRIAITTGGADSMECLPLRMGIEASEFTTNAGDGRIHLFGGTDSGTGDMASIATKALDSGEVLPHADTLWSTSAALGVYDITILSCEGDSNENMRPDGARQALFDYSTIGGRVFASHWHHRWISEGPNPFPDTGTWNDLDNPANPSTATINQSFPKGMALAQWLVTVGASTTAGSMQVLEARNNVQAVNAMYATEWMTVPGTSGGRGMGSGTAVEYLSFNTPLTLPETERCGRVVYSDLHVSNASDMGTPGDNPGMPFPSHCAVRDLTPQEKAVVFMLFDLSSCVQDETMPPEPPR